MGKKSIAIIGAGLAGLATGCYAQLNGYQSHIFEQRAVPGGVAACWTRRGYLIDGGIHFVMGHRPGTSLHDLYRELGTAHAGACVDMPSYGRFLDEVSGRSVLVTADLESLASELRTAAPSDGRVIDDLISGARAMRGLELSGVGMSRPPELSGTLDQMREYWAMRRGFRCFLGKYGRTVAEYVRGAKSPWLRECIRNLFLPEVPVWFVCMLLGLVADDQLGLTKRGSEDFVSPIAKRYEELGGQVTYRAAVEEIIVENDRAVGVRLADGGEHRADRVVSAADGYSTIFQMLGGRYVHEKLRDRYCTWPLIRPLVMISLGVDRHFTGEPWLSVISLADPIKVGVELASMIMVRIFNYSAHFSPPGKTVVQIAFETEWDY